MLMLWHTCAHIYIQRHIKKRRRREKRRKEERRRRRRGVVTGILSHMPIPEA